MYKVNTVLLLFLICVAYTQARIWFIGEPMPGSNRTIPEEVSSTPSWAPPMNIDRSEKVIGQGVTKMALSLEKVIGTETDNTIFAPISVAAALSVTLLGAAGKTAAEIAYFLGVLAGIDFTDRTQIVHKQLGRYFTKFESNPGLKLGTELAFANGVFVQEGFPIEPKFDALAREIYRCEVIPVDFMRKPANASQVVNQWVSKRTNGRIKKMIPHSLDPVSKVIIANAFYFNGQWEYPFHGKTKIGSFRVSKNEVIPMPLMVTSADEIPYFHSSNYTIFGMPYKGGELIMYIVLPEKNLHKFVSNLTVDDFENMIKKTKVQPVLYVVPRMKMESELDLRSPLEQIGIHSIFDSKDSDLSGISKGLYVNNIYHKVEIQVTETGTIAAASTATIINRGGVPLVRVARPFLFFIYHKPTSSIIFWGSIFRPTPYHVGS